MLSETLSKGLAQYEIGAKIKALRLGKGLGQVELGAHTGLSPALLSKIERGQLFPTLPTLLRIALVFGVGLEHFFIENNERPALTVTRKRDRVRLPEKMGQQSPAYLFESLDFSLNDRRMSGYYAIFPPTTMPSAAHQHKGEEMIYVLKGQLAIEVGGVPSVLEEGDSIHFLSAALHSYRCHGRSTAMAIVVVADQGAR